MKQTHLRIIAKNKKMTYWNFFLLLSFVPRTLGTDCGSYLTAESGSIASPNFPALYPRNAQCLWTIVVPIGNVIYFNFTTFRLEDEEHGVGCIHDFVSVYHIEGFSNGERVCGVRETFQITSKSNRAVIQFNTDDRDLYTGFQALYETMPTSMNCGGEFSQRRGRIVTPDYPLTYPNNSLCHWHITAPSNDVIELNFTVFDLESHDQCHYDFVLVYHSETDSNVNRFCGVRDPFQIKSMANRLVIVFASDYSVGGMGFEAFYALSSTKRRNSEKKENRIPQSSEDQNSTPVGLPIGTTFLGLVFGIGITLAVCLVIYRRRLGKNKHEDQTDGSGGVATMSRASLRNDYNNSSKGPNKNDVASGESNTGFCDVVISDDTGSSTYGVINIDKLENDQYLRPIHEAAETAYSYASRPRLALPMESELD